jgi:RimJ/RimL family protein N-acetyltransferase
MSDRYLYNSLREEDWIRNAYKSDNDMPFAVCLRDGDVHIGNCALHKIDRLHRFALFEILIGEKDQWSKGYGTEVTRLLVDYAFRAQNMNRVELSAFDFNKRAIRCYEKAGFVEEGRLRKKFYKDGAYHDEVVMSVLREDWPGLKE